MARPRRRMGALVSAVLVVSALGRPTAATAGGPKLSADLDGQAIALADVGKYHCDDVDYPQIHCYKSEQLRDAAALPVLAASSTAYVIAWDYPGYSGPSFIFTQDYTALITIGWHDRISSFKAQNSQTGHWYVDWFYLGSTWSFCCNVMQPLLGGYDDTFSSVHRL